MGIFDRLFGKKDQHKSANENADKPLEIKATKEMLDESKFWDIVNTSVIKTENQDDQEFYIIKQIEKLEPSEMIGFRLRTDKLLHDSYNSELWCAGYIMNCGCSDDGFEYFRNWIISRGQRAYENALSNPDSLIDEFQEGMEYFEFESFWYLALQAFNNKTGKDLYDFISDEFNYGEGKYENFKLTWQEDNQDSMKAICPRLFAKFDEIYK